MDKSEHEHIEEWWNNFFMSIRGEKPTVQLLPLLKSKWPNLYNMVIGQRRVGKWVQAAVTALLDQSGVKVVDAEVGCDCMECVGRRPEDRPHDVDMRVILEERRIPIQFFMFEGALMHDSDVVDKKYGAVDTKSVHSKDTELIRHKIRKTPPGGITLIYTTIVVAPDDDLGAWSYDMGAPDDDWWYEGVEDRCIILWRKKSDKVYHVVNEDSADRRFVLARSGTCSIYHGVGGHVDAAKELCGMLGHERIVPQVIKPRHSPKIPKNTPPMPFCPRTVAGLKAAVSADPKKWTGNPDSVIAVLCYPDYVRAYFEELRGAGKEIQTDGLVPVLRHVVGRHGESAREYAVDEEKWRRSVSTMLSMLEALAETNSAKFDQNTLVEICGILQDVASGRHEDYVCEMLHRNEINKRLHLQALFCLTYMVMYRLGGRTPLEVLETLTTTTRLGGQEGRECRIVLGCALIEGLQGAIPDWYKENESLLFGEDSPDGMNTVLIRILCSQQVLDPAEFTINHPVLDVRVMEQYHAFVVKAMYEEIQHVRRHKKTERGVGKSDLVRHFIYHMLGGAHGYGVEDSVRILANIGPDAVSMAAHECGWLTMQEDIKEFVGRAVQFWETALDLPLEPAALYGFGSWASTKSVNQDTWERLTLRTCKDANGSVDSPTRVVYRASSDGNPTKTGIQIIELILRADRRISSDLIVRDALIKMRKNNVLINIE